MTRRAGRAPDFLARLVAALVVVAGVSGVSCASEDAAAADAAAAAGVDDSCTFDEDCVPASCCHAVAAVNVASAPDCTAGFCSAEFIPCSDDEADVVPVCSLGRCALRRPPWCPVTDALR